MKYSSYDVKHSCNELTEQYRWSENLSSNNWVFSNSLNRISENAWDTVLDNVACNLECVNCLSTKTFFK